MLGDFSGRTFEHQGVTTRFYRRDGGYFVHTDGPDGRPAEFKVAYLFGVTPLEQYLLELPGGRLQALGIALGQPAESRTAAGASSTCTRARRIDHKDVLHWTKLSQNWNTQCAECHSTNLRKGYDLAENRFSTTFAELNVSCEACHGPGARHVEWARAGGRARPQAGRGVGPGRELPRASQPDRHDGRGARDGDARGRRRRACRGRDLRALPRAARPADGGVPARPAARPDAPAVAPRRGPLLRRRPDAGRGVQLGLVPAEPHVRRRGHLLGLPRPARRQAAGRAGPGLRDVPRADDVRHAAATTCTARRARAPPASPATCAPRPTWSWTRATTTRSGCPGPT